MPAKRTGEVFIFAPFVPCLNHITPQGLIPSFFPTNFLQKSSKVRKSLTDTTHVFAILGTMMSDQREHKCAQFGEAYFTVNYLSNVCILNNVHTQHMTFGMPLLSLLHQTRKSDNGQIRSFLLLIISHSFLQLSLLSSTVKSLLAG